MNVRKVVREPVMVWQCVEASEASKSGKSIIDAFVLKKYKSCFLSNIE
jgi:hypothetical protein